MRFIPGETTVQTPSGRIGRVVRVFGNEIDVELQDAVAGTRIETFKAKDLTIPKKRSDKELTEDATKIINTGVKNATKPFADGSVVRKVSLPSKSERE